MNWQMTIEGSNVVGVHLERGKITAMDRISWMGLCDRLSEDAGTASR